MLNNTLPQCFLSNTIKGRVLTLFTLLFGYLIRLRLITSDMRLSLIFFAQYLDAEDSSSTFLNREV